MTGCVPYRCLDTASIVLADMQLTNVNTEELIRETLGSDTCDARRSVSDPPGGGKPETGPCAFDRGLKSKYPAYDFPGRESNSPSGLQPLSGCQSEVGQDCVVCQGTLKLFVLAWPQAAV